MAASGKMGQRIYPAFLCVLWLLILRVNSQVCSVSDPDTRVDCGFAGMQSADCNTVSCCWDDSIGGTSWCYYKQQAACASVASQDRDDCGFSGITGLQCVSRNCCYDTSTTGGIPWCFHTVTCPVAAQRDASTRVECGVPGISETDCLSNQECCFDSSILDVIWCFFREPQ